MHLPALVVGMALVAAGLGAVALAALRSTGRSGALSFLEEVPTGTEAVAGAGPAPAVDPLTERLLRPAAKRLIRQVRRLFPKDHLDRIHLQLLHAGLSTRLRAEEFGAIQVALAAAGTVLGVAVGLGGHGDARLRLLAVALLVVVTVMGPHAWLSRAVEARTRQIDRDLPDVLDLLTISVEAGLGFEAAAEAACADNPSPLAEELARMLQEMSLGLSRHDALDNLKHRSASPSLGTFVLVLTQANALGMPIGRVLRTQADELRERRRARAREQAAKLPVKILFPLMLFILPPLMIVVMGPAASGVIKAFHHS